MKISACTSLAFCIVLGAAGCSSDPAATYAQITWKLRCNGDGSVGQCTYDTHAVDHKDGQDDMLIECRLEGRDGGLAALYFDIFLPTGEQIKLDNAVMSENGGAIVGTGCELTSEEEVTRQATCGSDVPNPLQPCQLLNVVIDGSTVVGQLMCRDMPSAQGGVGSQRDLTGPGTNNGPTDFRLEHCDRI